MGLELHLKVYGSIGKDCGSMDPLDDIVRSLAAAFWTILQAVYGCVAKASENGAAVKI